MGDSPPPLQLHALTKHYGAVQAVEAVTFSIKAGEVFGYLGPNGAGKTTTIRCLMGLLQPTHGSVQLFGETVRHGRATQHHRLGYLPGEFRIWTGLRPRQSLKVLDHLGGGRCSGARRLDLARALQLDLDRPVRTLSKGNRQKVGVVCAFQHEPDLLVLDEPTSGLDPLMRQVVLDLIRAAAQGGAAVLLSSHDLSEVAAVADRVGILREGRLIRVASLTDLIHEEAHHLKVWFTPGHAPSLEDAPPPGSAIVKRQVDYLQLAYQGSPDAILKWLGQFRVEKFASPETSLEEAFLQYYRDPPDTGDR